MKKHWLIILTIVISMTAIIVWLTYKNERTIIEIRTIETSETIKRDSINKIIASNIESLLLESEILEEQCDSVISILNKSLENDSIYRLEIRRLTQEVNRIKKICSQK